MPPSASCFRGCRCSGARRAQISLCLDNIVPFGCSQHQKIIVVDNAVAFSGGLDLTIRRWDTTDHAPDNPDRVDPSGEPFKPFHDVQMMVDGDAARALAEIACERWSRAAACERPAARPSGDPWPDSVTPDFTDVDIGIARTQPCYDDQKEVREAEALFLDSIAAAQRLHLHREPVPDLGAGRARAGEAAARAKAARSPDRRAASPRTPGSRPRACATAASVSGAR